MSAKADNEILSQEIVYNKGLIIEEANVRSHGTTATRQRVNRANAVAVLILNTDSNKVILTRQFRYAISEKTTASILEIVAGKIDGDDTPEETVIREVEEEVGYKVQKEHIKFLLSCFVSPGYSSEQFFVYYATVSHADKVSEGGGLEEEHEYIDVVEMPVDEFTSLVRDGLIKDAKTYIAGLYMILQWH